MLEFVNVTFASRFDLDGSAENGGHPNYPGVRLSGCVFEKDAIVYIGNCGLGELTIERLVNFAAAVKLVNLRVTGQLTINDSNLGGAEINNVRLDGEGGTAPAVAIALSSFHGAVFNNVRWGDVSRIQADRDTFRQLKAAHDDIGNFLQGNEFYGMEMREYGREIGLEKGRWQDLLSAVEAAWGAIFRAANAPKGRAQEMIAFWLGKNVSKFSNDWVRPLWLFAVFSLIVFCFCDHIGHYFFSWDLVGEFVKFVNPFAHSSDGIRGKNAALWLFHKMIGTFIVYQFVVALRRKTKR